jgi:hypothetical protein
VKQLVEVLGREDLHRLIEHQRRPDRVRPDVVLAAEEPRQEPGRYRGAEGTRRPVAPEQHSLGVAEGGEIARLDHRLLQKLAHPRQDRGYGMGRQALGRPLRVQHPRRWAPRVDPGVGRAVPRVRHDLPDDARRDPGVDRDRVSTPQERRQANLVALGAKRQPRALRHELDSLTSRAARRPALGRTGSEDNH